MTRFAWAFLFAGLSGVANGQIAVPEVNQPHAPIVATCTVPSAGEQGSVQILWESDDQSQWIPIEDGRTLHVWAGPGSHFLKASVFAVDWEARTFSVTQHRAAFRVGGDDPPPTPDPTPEPDPPTPKPSQVTAVIIHESVDDTPAFARLVTALRSGDAAEQLAAGGNELIVLDDDATDVDGNPLEIVAALKALAVDLPAIFLLDGDAVLLSKSLPDDANADYVLKQIGQVLQ